MGVAVGLGTDVLVSMGETFVSVGIMTICLVEAGYTGADDGWHATRINASDNSTQVFDSFFIGNP